MSFPPTHPALAGALAARDYTVPTPVQSAVLEAATGTDDLLVSARTGSGKTVAFGLAMARTLLGDAARFEARIEAPLALVIAPTRELAQQVQRELAWLYADTGARITTCVGGMDPRAEARDLAVGAHIVVGTPGRLRDHLERGRLVLSGLRTVVLDEADEMLDLGFREDLTFLLDATPDTRQTLLFSATLPRAIVSLARRYQTNAVRIETAGGEEQHADIAYEAVRVASGEVEKATANILRFHEARAALVFCATREGVKRMHSGLLARGFAAVALSGELTQNERTNALAALREGRARVLVATDVAARGLDLPDLTLVIHADLPNDPETLLHRSGRTGRAGRKGTCILVVPVTRQRKAEALLFAAKLRVRWGSAPSAADIATRDADRFLADASFTEPATEAETAELATLQTTHTADSIALALLRLHRRQHPPAETISTDVSSRRAPDRAERGDRADRTGQHTRAHTDGPRPDAGPRPPRAPRVDGRPMTWFRLNIGRAQNADPRWLLPLICRSGGVTKTEVGAIKIFDDETRFEIVSDVADAFALAARTAKEKQGHISRIGADTPDDATVVDAAIRALGATETPPSRPPLRQHGKHTSLPLAERLAAKQAKPGWKERKTWTKTKPEPVESAEGAETTSTEPDRTEAVAAAQTAPPLQVVTPDRHTSLPLAERPSAKPSKPAWNERKPWSQSKSGEPGSPSPDSNGSTATPERRHHGKHTSLPLAERLAAKASKPGWKDRKSWARPPTADAPPDAAPSGDSAIDHGRAGSSEPRRLGKPSVGNSGGKGSYKGGYKGGDRGGDRAGFKGGGKTRVFAKKKPRPAEASSG